MKFGSAEMVEIYQNYNSGIFTVKYIINEGYGYPQVCNFHLNYTLTNGRMTLDTLKKVLRSYICAKEMRSEIHSMEIINYCPDVVKEVSLEFNHDS